MTYRNPLAGPHDLTGFPLEGASRPGRSTAGCSWLCRISKSRGGQASTGISLPGVADEGRAPAAASGPQPAYIGTNDD